MYPTIHEFRDYVPAIIKGENLSNLVRVNHSNIEVKLFSIPNTQNCVIITINHAPYQIYFRIKLPKYLAGKVVIFNQKPITNLSKEAGFNTFLKAYEVRLYRVGM